MSATLARLRAMSRDEVAWRVRTSARMRTQHAATLMKTPHWHREDVAHALAAAAMPGELRAAIADRDWSGVHRALFDALRTRPSRFVLDAHAAAKVRSETTAAWPDARCDAVERADRILRGRYDLLGYRGLSFAEPAHGGVDWHLDPVHGRRVPMQFWSSVPYLDPAWGDHKVIWELNRHQHWVGLTRALWLSGDGRYADAIVRDLRGWLAANPPLMGANWASMLELAFRSLSWVWGLHAMLAAGHTARAGDEPWLVDLLVALDRQLTQVERNLSLYFSPNTHLTGEALALYVAGTALPELARGAIWVDLGRRVLLHEIDRQIEPDGGHVERSTHYHRYTLDFYLLALLTARRSGDLDAEHRFAEAVQRLARCALALSDETGRLPRIGDDDAGMLWKLAGRDSADVRDSLALAATLLDQRALAPWGMSEEVLWLTSGDPDAFARAVRWITAGWTETSRPRWERDPRGRVVDLRERRDDRRRPSAVQSGPVDRRERGADRRGQRADAGGGRVTSVFPHTGVIAVRDATGDHLLMDVGPHGYLNGGHAHADALAVTLSLRGKPLLVDPGTPTYTMDPALRDHLRSSAGHNTLTIDRRSSSVPNGPFHWARTANAQLDAERHNAGFTFIEASHDGYEPLRHRRLVFASDGGYLFVDQVLGGDRHEASAHWHFDPRWLVTCATGQALRAVHDGGDVAWLLHDSGALWLVHGDEESRLGWCSPAYGVRVPAWTARLTHADTAPFSMVSWCGASPGDVPPTLERIRAAGDSAGEAIAVRIDRGADEWVTLFRPGALAAREARNAAAGDYHTNARALQYSSADGALTSLSGADLSHALALREGLLSLAADQAMPDLHVARDGERLTLWARVPPGRLRLHGAMVAGVTCVTLNGRELPPRPPARRDAVAISSADWAEPGTTNAAARTANREPRTGREPEPEHEPRTEHAEA